MQKRALFEGVPPGIIPISPSMVRFSVNVDGGRVKLERLGNGRGLQTRAGHEYRWSWSQVGVGELKPQENPHPQQGFDGFSGVSFIIRNYH